MNRNGIKKWNAGIRSRLLLCALVMSACVLTLAATGGLKTRAAAADSMVIYAIDLGTNNRGEATMVVDGSGGSLLIDTGIDKGDDLFQWLDKQKYHKKKFSLLITHWHDDHVAYAERLVTEYHIGTVYLPKTEYADSHYIRIHDRIVRAAKKRNTRIEYLKKGKVISVGKKVKGKVLYVNGYREYESDEDRKTNNECAAILFSGGGSTFLTCGDALREEERILLRSGADIKADIFKMNHHGYRDDADTNWKFIKKVSPSYVWFTTKDSNDKKEENFRPESVRELVRQADSISNVFSTGYNGTIRFCCRGGAINVSAERNTGKMYRIRKDKKTGKESTVTFTFNTASIPTLTDKLINSSRYSSRQVDSKGRMFSGKKQNGSPYLRAPNGMYAVDTMAKDGSKYYLVQKNGKVYTGWKEIGGKNYYFRPERATGFTVVRNKATNRTRTYYFMDEKCPGYTKAKEGTIYKGFLTIGKRRYYLIDKRLKDYKDYLAGTMARGWKKIGEKRYYMDSHGIIQTGLRTIKGKTYCFSSKGIMLTGLQTVDGKKYCFSKAGVMLKKYRTTINGVRYYFDKNGVGSVVKSR